jgi:FkbM family methyltransferase
MSIYIQNCFNIGYRCTTDNFMIRLNIRKYSSPFSYMVCDLQTSLQFIQNDFEDFLNIVSKQYHNFRWNNKPWNHHLFFNHKFIPYKDNININTLKRICVWNHHDLNNITIINSIKRRCLRLLNADKLSNILYIYIDNIQTYETDNWENYFPKEIVLNFIQNKTNRYILLLLPLLNFNNNPVLYKINTYLNVIFYESNIDGNTNDSDNPKIKWNLLHDLVLQNYTFDIKVDKEVDTKIDKEVDKDKVINKTMERLGTVYGGWYVPINMNLNENSIIYSGGVGEDMSFDILLTSKYNCNIFLIDPTIRAIKHFDEVKLYYTKGQTFTGNIQNDYYKHIKDSKPNLEHFIYINKGLWDCKTELNFYKQSNKNYVSQTLIENMYSNEYYIVEVDTIKNIMEENKHTNIDLLKLDIEGAEIKVLEQMFNEHIYPTYLLIEFDLLLKGKDKENSTSKLIERILTTEHYSLLVNDNFNITFVRTI